MTIHSHDSTFIESGFAGYNLGLNNYAIRYNDPPVVGRLGLNLREDLARKEPVPAGPAPAPRAME